jgi:hypothetical protein
LLGSFHAHAQGAAGISALIRMAAQEGGMSTMTLTRNLLRQVEYAGQSSSGSVAALVRVVRSDPNFNRVKGSIGNGNESALDALGPKAQEALLQIGRNSVFKNISTSPPLSPTGKIKVAVKGERATRAEQLLQRPLNPMQQIAIEKAHWVGAGEAGKEPGTRASLYNYTYGQIRQKHQILSGAGFTKEEIKTLMDNEVVGLFDVFRRNESLEYHAYAKKILSEIDSKEGMVRLSFPEFYSEDFFVIEFEDRYLAHYLDSKQSVAYTREDLENRIAGHYAAVRFIERTPVVISMDWSQTSEVPWPTPPFEVGERLSVAAGYELTGTVVKTGNGYLILETEPGHFSVVPYNHKTMNSITRAKVGEG